MITERKKRPKPEDFIGWKSPDGKLEVIGVAGKQGYKTLYKVTCTECSKDPELFPDGYFVSLKDNLIRGKLLPLSSFYKHSGVADVQDLLREYCKMKKPLHRGFA